MRYVLFFVFITCYHACFTQISQPQRFEIEIDDFYEPYNIVSAGENGIFIFKDIPNKSTKDEFLWEIIQLDTALQEVYRREVFIDKKYTFKGYCYEEGKFVMLFQEGLDYAEEMLFITFSINDINFKSYIYDNLVPINLTEFEMKKDAVVFGGNVNTRSVLMIYNFTAEKGIVLPGFYNDRSNLLQIQTRSDDNFIRILTTERRFDKTYGVTVRGFDTQGSLIFTENLDASGDISLNNGRIVDSSTGGNLIAGTYAAKRRTETSRGLYIADLDKEEGERVNFYNYANLDNFFNYMREKRKNRIKKRIARKKIKGKKLKFSYRLYVQDIIKHKDHNILIGEAYYPTYNSQSYNYRGYGGFDPGFNNSHYGRGSSQAFDGYKYTHAVLMGFDDSGKLLWDNSFEISDLKTFQLQTHVHVGFSEDQIVMLYLYDQKLQVKIIKGSEIVEGKFSEELKLKYENDEMKANSEDLEGLEKWHGNTFYAYGVNRVKNLKDSDIQLNRKVFFINKIVVE